MGSSSQNFGMKIQKIFELPPPLFCQFTGVDSYDELQPTSSCWAAKRTVSTSASEETWWRGLPFHHLRNFPRKIGVSTQKITKGQNLPGSIFRGPIFPCSFRFGKGGPRVMMRKNQLTGYLGPGLLWISMLSSTYSFKQNMSQKIWYLEKCVLEIQEKPLYRHSFPEWVTIQYIFL